MNKRLIALVSCAVLLLSSISLAVSANSAKEIVAVDAVAAATTTAPATPAAPGKSSGQASKPTTTPAANITRLLAFGSVGGDVTLLQVLLNNNGYVLKTDGIFGEKTLAAVEGYQGKNALRVDGIVGPKTLAKLLPVVAEVVEPEEPVEEKVDAVTTPSVVRDAATLEKVSSKDGNWIICFKDDITTENELVVEGEFAGNKKDEAGNPIIDRKIAIYDRDDNKVTTATYTLTAPKLTIKSPKARLQGGTFIGEINVEASGFRIIDANVEGDVYVSTPGFQLVGAKVEGNIYFTTQEAKDSFEMDEKSSVTGEIALMNVDATTSASIVRDEASFEKAIVKKEDKGTWIAAVLKDMRFNKDLTLEGEFENSRGEFDRKIGLYSNKTLEDKTKVVTHRFTLTVPRLFIKSPNARMFNGIFNGNLYVSSDNFKLQEQIINGGIYFTTQSAKDSFIIDDKSVINGDQEVIDVDAIASASVVTDEVNFEKAISKHGKWIICLEDDITTDKELVLEGNFLNKRYAVQRKIALYTQDDKKTVTGEFTLKAPKLTIKSPNARLQNGTFVGDIYVEAPQFQLVGTKVEGNIYFLNEEVKSTFKMDEKSSVSGVLEIK